MGRMRHIRETPEALREIEAVRKALLGKTDTFAKEVWCKMLGKPASEYDRSAAVRMGVIMTSYCGWIPTGIRINIEGERHWLMRAPDAKPAEPFADILG